MSDDAKRGYTMLARLFLVIGGGFALLALLQRTGTVHIFHGDPLGLAVLVLVIGVLLWWTVRTAPPPPVEEDDEETGEA
ncbi:MAG TPA: hypothetical protein VKB31_01210 [Trueperaceae bacterium]|nr:hypothetical protein [Trueperaceae bacterium]